jgi:hypothetical protein
MQHKRFAGALVVGLAVASLAACGDDDDDDDLEDIDDTIESIVDDVTDDSAPPTT